MARLGLTWEALSAINSRLVCVGCFGYAQDGPYAAKPAYDDLIQGALGLPSLIAQIGDGVPRYVPIAMIDRTVGVATVSAVCAALYRREKTGVGQTIDVPMFETMVPFMLGEHLAGHSFEPPIGELGYPRMLARERTPFPTRDGYVCTLIYTDRHWQRFFEMIGRREDFERDPRLANFTTRTVHIAELYALVAGVLRTRTTAEWLALFEQADIPAMPLNTLASLIEDPQLAATGYFRAAEHPSEGAYRQLVPPQSWSESPPTLRRHAPRLGEHSAEILRELGYDEVAIDALVASGATHCA
jgi:crotonobetainyl-CoA:carnitine CoA-transferase CaiB-like acyl-CoA transferase